MGSRFRPRCGQPVPSHRVVDEHEVQGPARPGRGKRREVHRFGLRARPWHGPGAAAGDREQEGERHPKKNCNGHDRASINLKISHGIRRGCCRPGNYDSSHEPTSGTGSTRRGRSC